MPLGIGEVLGDLMQLHAELGEAEAGLAQNRLRSGAERLKDGRGLSGAGVQEDLPE